MNDFSADSYAFYGLGAMGMPIACKLSSPCHPLIVRDLDGDKIDQICAEFDAQRGDEGAVTADCIFLCLPHPGAVGTVINQILARPAKNHRLIIDFGAHAPDFVGETVARCGEKNVTYCDAPVFGTPSMAVEGRLYFLFSGPQPIYAGFSKLAKRVGYRSRFAGPSGTASAVKLLQNALGTINLLAAAEILKVCEATDIDTTVFADVVNECGGIGSSQVFTKFASDMVNRRDSNEGRLRIAAKDMQTAANLAHKSGEKAVLLLATAQQFKRAYDAGMGEDQFSNIIKTL